MVLLQGWPNVSEVFVFFKLIYSVELGNRLLENCCCTKTNAKFEFCLL